MPCETRWYIKKKLLYQRFYGVVTLEDFKQSIETAGAFVAEGDPLIHTVADLLEIEKWPPLAQMSKAARREPFPGVGWTVIIVSNPALRFVAGLLVQFTLTHFRVAASLDEALKFIAERDNTLTIP